jgi:hypothetical protein
VKNLPPDQSGRKTSPPAVWLVSDKTATTILSLPSPTTFLPFLLALGITPLKVGRRWYARLDAILAAIDTRTGATPPRSEWSEEAMIAKACGRGSR